MLMSIEEVSLSVVLGLVLASREFVDIDIAAIAHLP